MQKLIAAFALVLVGCGTQAPSSSGLPAASVEPSASPLAARTPGFIASPTPTESLPALPGARGLVAFLRNGSGRGEVPDTDIFLIDADGTGLRNLTDDDLVQSEPYWLLDGSRLVFPVADFSSNPYMGRLVSVLPDGTKVGDLGPVPTASGSTGSRSPTGRFVAWGGGSEGLTLLDLATGTARQLSRGYTLDPLWSPDGRWLAVSVPDEGVVVINARTGDRIGLVDLPFEHQVAHVIGWAADGRIVFEGDGGPDYAAEPSGGEPTRFTGDVVSPRFEQPSPDGQWLADVQRGSGGIHFDLYVAPASGGEPIRPTSLTVFPASAYCWSRDSAHIVLGASTAAYPNSRRPIALVSVRGDEVRLTDDHRDAFPACRPHA